ncbi:MAG: tyrosine-type recombinase/integrase [candidate division Zixibacteria bacterium]|nr:tyrosine-type recombinase/integrase [candidate division Zixibacteria bacterium]
MSSRTLHASIRKKQSGITVTTLNLLSAIPEEELWLASQQSEQTRRDYREDAPHFVKTIGISSREDLRQVDRAAVIAWQHAMKDQNAKPSTIRRRLAALSSLFNHLVHVRAADINPVREIKRPRINRKKGTMAAFSPKEARAILDAPESDTLAGLRDRAILSVGFQVDCRRSEIASLKVDSLHTNAGYPSLRLVRKGGDEHSLAIHPKGAQRIREYLEAAGHGQDFEGPLFRPVKSNSPDLLERRFLNADVIDRILRKFAKKALGVDRGYSAHSMRATFITTALENGANLEDVQEAVGHADPSTTKLYDRRGYNPEKAASFFANY